MPLPERSPRALASTPGTQLRKLKRGELLFAEGENSRAMYLIKNGMLRLFKRKGDANIELDTVHSGQIVGELAFLDGNPRSASGEALTDMEIVEISGPAFQEVLVRIPDWLKILLKTIVARLRSASTRIRQLESSSSAYDFDKDGKRSAHYVFLSPSDVLKVLSSLLLVGSRAKAAATGKAVEIRPVLLHRYANQIMQVPLAKVTTLLDVLAQAGMLVIGDAAAEQSHVLQDSDLLEGLIGYLNEENLIEPSKRHDISVRGFLVMSLIAKHLSKGTKNADGTVAVNVAEIRKLETRPDGKEAFRPEEFGELVKLGYASALNVKTNDEMLTNVTPDSFVRIYRFQRIVLAVKAANEQKAKGSGGTKAA